jgi:hypothetical protein
MAAPDAAAMSTIVSRSAQPETRLGASIRPSEAPSRRWSGGELVGASVAQLAPPSPARELARRALDVLRRARPASPPERWLDPAFGREVDLVRLHLAPVRTRAGLASSFEREAFNVVDDSWSGAGGASGAGRPTAGRPIGPVYVAYALRWLELGDGRHRGPFREWLADSAERTLR